MTAAEHPAAVGAALARLPRRGVGPARRTLDLLVALGAGVLLSPVLAAAAVAVAVTSGRPVVFRQERIGEGGKSFVIYKLRTMSRSDASGPQVTAGGDARVTRVGRALRVSSVDELPQLLNVLRGDMTLVGPRPETPDLARRYPPACRWVLQHRPGLTGPAQIALRDAHVLSDEVQDVERVYVEQLVPQRVALDAGYLASPTLRATLRVLVRTAVHLVRPSATLSH